MSARPQDPDFVKDSSLLYELSLAIGTSLDLSENCEGFLKTLLARKNLDYAAVWLKTSPRSQEAEAEGYTLAYAIPTSRVDARHLPATHPVVTGLQDADDCYSIASDDPAFTQVSTERNVAQGAYAVFSLGDLGLLKLYSSRRRHPFEARWFNQLRNVLAKFTVSLQGCLAHEQLRSEIQERARTNEQLRAATSRLSALIENLQAGILVEDDHRRVALANQGFCDLFGVPVPPDALIGSDCAEALEQSKDFFLEPEVFVDRIEKLLAARKVVVGEEWALVDGRIFARDYIPIFLDGIYRGHLWQYRDVTERRQAMMALEESEARKHAIFAMALDGIITIDEAGRVLEFNEAAEATFGYRREEIVGQSMVDYIVPPHLRAAHRQGMARYQDTGAGKVLGKRIEITALRADGTEFPVELAITPIRVGDREIFTAYLRDITERKQAEEALRASNALLQVISRIQSHFIADLNPHALFEELLAELLNITDSEYGFIGEVRYAADGQPYLKTFALTNIAWDEATRAFYDENAPQGLEFRNLDTLFGAALKTGTVVMANDPADDPRSGGLPPGHPPLNAFLGIPFSRGDHLIGMVGIANRPGGYDKRLVAYLEPLLATCTNIIEAWHTEVKRREAKEALRFSKDELELQTVQLQKIVRELDQARHLAEQSMKAREQFLANMSHEIRTPMNAILGMSHLLRQTQPTEEQQKYLAAITRSSDNLLALINDILDIAKIESGKITFEEVPFRLNEVTQHLVDMVQFDAQEKGLSLAVHLPKDLPDVLIGDSVRLNQVLLNLISNAIKFTEAGSVVVTARVVARHTDRVEVQFEVADTGIGISEEHLEQIFESFTQARSDTTRKYGGTGLGLAIVKELVERQGGTVAVESTVGEGSVFTVALPFRIGSEAALGLEEHARLDVDSIDLGGARILLVEDNELNQLVACNMLKQWGAQVDVAENGRVALERLRQAAYALVLMDIQMPEMDGYEATRRIRNELHLSALKLPILALTASVLIDHREHLEAAGMNDVILKPFDPHDLHRRVALHLGLYAPSADTAPPLDPTVYVDLAFLKANALGNEAFIPRMIDLFLSQTPDFLRRLEQALAEADWPQVKFIAHKMKSSAGMLGIGALQAALRTVERHASEKVHLDELPHRIETVVHLCEGAMEELTRVRQDFEAGNRPVSTR